MKATETNFLLNLDTASIREEYKKHYIAYKTSNNFVDIVPKRNSLNLYLNLQFTEIEDPQKKCRDMTDRGCLGNGDIEIKISSKKEINYTIFLIRQAFDRHYEK
ncbi:MAG: DUF5655 domain-containing protein [Prochloraceae cyanobacterium]